jgi:propanediol dehydratase large subunit
MKLCRENIANVTDIMTEAKRTELMSVMEVRMIMHVMNNKRETRTDLRQLGSDCPHVF